VQKEEEYVELEILKKVSQNLEEEGSVGSNFQKKEEREEDSFPVQSSGAERTPSPVLRRSTRETHPVDRYSPSNYFLLLAENGKPQSDSESADQDDSF